MALPGNPEDGIDSEGDLEGGQGDVGGSIEELIALGSRQTQDQDSGPEDEEGDGDEDEDGGDEDEESPPAAQTQAPGAPPAGKLTSQEWADELRKNPARLSEIPGKQREEVLRLAFERQDQAAVAAITQAREAERQTIESEKRINEAIAEIDALKDDDPDAYAEWEQEYPDRAAAYHSFKARKGRVDPVATAMAEASKPIMERLQANPAALAIITERDKAYPGRYAPTSQGLANLMADATDAIIQAAAPKKDDVQAQKALEARKQQQGIRANRPHIDASEGRRGAAALPTDMHELIATGWREEAKARRNGRV